ncbi:MAG TPA: ATP-dependent Clp protease proteolytic subunit [Candidatus Paceibacterota bacterium]|nr:ATP-dependent Clp protease proteolytic subunit [Candidatus Paceibacterota bacterium]
MYQCSPSRTISFFDEINGKSMENLGGNLGKAVLTNDDKWISLFLCSGGGNLNPAFAIYELVRHILRPKLQTVALGQLGSIAPLLYLMGDHRVITPETTLWFHHVYQSYGEKTRINTLTAERVGKELLLQEEKYFRIIEERTCGKTTKREARSLLRNERTLSAKDAVRLGFAHEIISIKDPC